MQLASNHEPARKYTVQTESAENFPDETEGSASQDAASQLQGLTTSELGFTGVVQLPWTGGH